jgi:AP-1-like factor
MVSTSVTSTPIFKHGTDELLLRDKLANRPEFKDGTIDIDNLCSELRAKARCSESGVVVDDKDVEAALQRLPESQRT